VIGGSIDGGKRVTGIPPLEKRKGGESNLYVKSDRILVSLRKRKD